MARYDRIERLPLPDRSAIFDGWPAVADLAGNERDTELGRRARLRFLALRPVHRLLRHGWDAVPSDSLTDQLRSVREELGQLGSRDPERTRLGDLLTAVAGRSAPDIVAATLALGRLARERRHVHAAEECFRVGAAVAARHDLHAAHAEAAGLLGATLCATELHALRIDAALEHGWSALRTLNGAERAAVLFDMARAFRLVGIRTAADACYELISTGGAAGQRALARVEHAGTAAEGGDRPLFTRRRAQARAAMDGLEPEDRARALVRLGRAALRIGAADDARLDLREAVQIAGAEALPDVVDEAEELIGALEEAATALLALPEPRRAGPVAREVAAEVAALPLSGG